MSRKRVTKKIKMQREEKRKRKEQQKFVENLRKEIDNLENNLSNIKSINAKRAIIKNIRIAGRHVLKWFPTVAAGIIISIPYNEYVGKPFKSVPISTPMRVEQKVDTLGHIHEKRQLIDYDSTSSYLDYYTEWHKDGDLYKRTIKRYFLSEELVNKCIEVANGDLITNFDTLFSVPNYVVEETSNNLTEEELSTPTYAEIIHYYKDENNRGMRMTTTFEVVGISGLYILAVLAANFGTALLTSGLRRRCDQKIRRYKADYRPLDEIALKKELVLKKDNYNALVGE